MGDVSFANETLLEANVSMFPNGTSASSAHIFLVHQLLNLGLSSWKSTSETQLWSQSIHVWIADAVPTCQRNLYHLHLFWDHTDVNDSLATWCLFQKPGHGHKEYLQVKDTPCLCSCCDDEHKGKSSSCLAVVSTWRSCITCSLNKAAAALHTASLSVELKASFLSVKAACKGQLSHWYLWQ